MLKKKKKSIFRVKFHVCSCSQAASNNTLSKQKIFNYRSSSTPEAELVKENCWCVLRQVPCPCINHPGGQWCCFSQTTYKPLAERAEKAAHNGLLLKSKATEMAFKRKRHHGKKEPGFCSSLKEEQLDKVLSLQARSLNQLSHYRTDLFTNQQLLFLLFYQQLSSSATKLSSKATCRALMPLLFELENTNINKVILLCNFWETFLSAELHIY